MPPIYEYSCEKCKRLYEVMHKHTEQPKIVCDECSKPVVRIISSTTFRLNGEGWGPTAKKHHFDTPFD